MNRPFARIGILTDADDRYAPGCHEVLGHFGLVHETIDRPNLRESLKDLDILLLCGYGEVLDHEVALIEDWVFQGGHLMCVGSTWGLGKFLGVVALETVNLGRSQLVPPGLSTLKLWPEETLTITFFGGELATVREADELIRLSEPYAGLTMRRMGGGAGWFFAPHIGQTLVQMQMGRGAVIKSSGPRDGSADFRRGPIREEDGIALDFEEDRISVEHGTWPFFGTPHADLCKEVFLRAILASSRMIERPVIMTWFWPDNADGQALLHVECEDHDGEKLYQLKEFMDVSNVPATWLVAPPGYSLDNYRMIRRWGDEVGLFFDGSHWSDHEVKSQYLTLSRTSGMPHLVAIRPTAGRWHHYTTLYDLSDSAGSRLSLGSGGRQAGTAGFCFGTCHPYFPIKPEGSRWHTMALPGTIFQPGVVTPTPVMHHIFRQTNLRHGAVSVTLDSDFVHHDHGPISMKQVFLLARQYKLDWTLPTAFWTFQKGRRALKWAWNRFGHAQVTAETELHDVTFLVGSEDYPLAAEGRRVRTTSVTRFGNVFQAVTVRSVGREGVQFAPAFGEEEAAA
jgi:hypothetical protein